MTVIPRLLATFALVASVAATTFNVKSSSECKSGEFFYSEKSCCISSGTTVSKGSAPSGKTCPSSSGNWYWSNDQSCCLPSSEPEQGSTPTCPSTHSWDSSNSCCTEKGSTTSSTPAKTSSASTPTGSASCSSKEFWFEPKSCCLTSGSSTGKGSAPSGKSCPTSDGNWYWSNDKDCCLPETKPSSPTPTCGSGHSWDHDNSCCSSGSGSSTTTTYNPGPSQKSHKKRGHVSRSSSLCPTGLEACYIMGSLGLSSDYECIDTAHELESCGGCASTGAGQDCTAIEGAWNVGCVSGTCAVYNCMPGYRLAADKSACVAL